MPLARYIRLVYIYSWKYITCMAIKKSGIIAAKLYLRLSVVLVAGVTKVVCALLCHSFAYIFVCGVNSPLLLKEICSNN